MYELHYAGMVLNTDGKFLRAETVYLVHEVSSSEVRVRDGQGFVLASTSSTLTVPLDLVIGCIHQEVVASQCWQRVEASRECADLI